MESVMTGAAGITIESVTEELPKAAVGNREEVTSSTIVGGCGSVEP